MSHLRHVSRQFLARPFHAALLVAVIALGIGPTTAMYAMTDAMLFRPLPVVEPASLVRIFRVDDAGRPAGSMSFPAYEDFRDRVDSFAAVAAYTIAPFNVGVGEAPVARVLGASVTGDYFTAFAMPPLQGRYLVPGDDRVRGGHAVAVVGERFARRHDVAAGATVRINNSEFEVVGVMPARFTDAAGGPEMWTPKTMMETTVFQDWDARTNRGVSRHDVIARLRPGVSRDTAQAELEAVVASVLAETGDNPRFLRYGLVDASYAAIDAYGGRGTRRTAVILFGLTATLLLIALMNAASLMMVRTEERAREFALRMGLGAGRGRLIRMLAAEAAVFAAVGALLGATLGWLLVEAGATWLRSVFGWQGVEGILLLHWRVAAFAAAAALLAVLLAVVMPALRVARLDLNTALKDGAPHERGHGAAIRIGASALQVALSVALLAVALLLVRSLWNTAAVEPGFAADGVLVAEIDLMRQGYTSDEAARFRETLLERLDTHPLVERAAFTSNLPLAGSAMAASFTVVGDDPPSFRSTELNAATTGFFEVLRIPLVAGRMFTSPAAEDADAPREAVVSQAFARAVFGEQEAVGKRIDSMRTEVEIVGVVGDVKHGGLREDAAPMLWMPLSLGAGGFMQPQLVVRARNGDPWSVAALVHDAVTALDRDAPLFNLRTLEEHVGASYRSARAMAYLLGAFAVLAVVLSASGLFGVLSWQVRTRTREIGIRMSLGATSARIRRTYIGRASLLATLSVPLGLIAAGCTARAMDDWLFGVAAVDVPTYLAVAAGAVAVAMIAAWLPASRAAAVAPAAALRDF